MNWKNGLVLGIIGGIVYTLIGLSFMMVPGLGEWYASIFPQMMSSAGLITTIVPMFLVGLFMGFFYQVLSPSIPGEGIKKGIIYGIMIWLLTGLMWPIMMMSFAPVYLWTIELIDGLLANSITGIAVFIASKKL